MKKLTTMRMSIRAKLLGGFMLVVILLLAVFGIAYTGLSDMGDKKDEVVKQSEIESHLQNMEYHAVTRYYMVKDWVASIGGPQEETYFQKAEAIKQNYYTEADTLRGLLPVDQVAVLEDIVKYGEAIITITGNTEGQMDLAAMMESNKASQAAKAALKGSATEAMLAAQKSADDAKTSAIIMTSIMAGIAVALALVIGFLISRSIANNTKKVVQAADQIADTDLAALASATAAMSEGDLTRSVAVQTQPIAVKSNDELGDLANSFNRMIARLHETGQSFSLMTTKMSGLIGKVAENSVQLSSASDQLASSAEQAGSATQQVASTTQQMAKGAGDQAVSTQETAKAVDQLTEVISQIAKGAQDQASGVEKATSAIGEVSTSAQQMAKNALGAADSAKKAAQTAKTGTEVTRKTVEGIERVRDSSLAVFQKISEMNKNSEQIGRIVAVIDDIAAQTNLLALNAAIEAARAGEHGRGFAVVADEVRKLAERSSTATKEIAALITGIQSNIGESAKAMEQGQHEVDEGCKLATQSGKALEEILREATEAANQIEQISRGAQQVSNSTNDLVSIIDSVGAVTEQSMAATEQMTANAQQVANAIENVAGIAEENSAATQETSASAEEMSSQVEEIVAASLSLKQMAEELQTTVSVFKTNGHGAHKDLAGSETLSVNEKVLVRN
ncbi:MAG: HAMP domain-containing methyl-accepting chemotaxis protein [Dehalococcoidia bacterium]|nr:HAMP domain-containing methyl-accepting chemotaxis protein [Dehalococcoidia bacterium]